jgi:hypothetical protein
MALSLAQKMGYSSNQAFGAATVTPNDSEDLPSVAEGVYIGGDGNLKVTLAGMNDGSFVIFVGLKAGSFLPIVAKRIWTATTATNILALS